MPLFQFREFVYYSFGLQTGIRSVFTNGLSLGVKKTLGKITQPINAFSRFPEYFYFDLAIRSHLDTLPPEDAVRILDVGSPKLLGLYLAATSKAEVTLTDISELNVEEYRVMWRGLERQATGRAVFGCQDARALTYPDGMFDCVYSMSVIEHIDGAAGDSTAVAEMIRVLKPGGLLVVSVPFGRHYAEQQRVGFVGAARDTGDSRLYFFQRIYDRAAFDARILRPAAALTSVDLTTIGRRHQWIAGASGALGGNLQGLLGFLNPLLSAAVNRARPGIDSSFRVKYGAVHTRRDSYSDVIMSGKKDAL